MVESEIICEGEAAERRGRCGVFPATKTPSDLKEPNRKPSSGQERTLKHRHEAVLQYMKNKGTLLKNYNYSFI